jgi:hypothetical protein
MNIPAILTYLDFEKVFDTVNWNFMEKCLIEIKNCKKTIYNDIQTCVATNGYVSIFLNLSRGIRHGCPISANISVLTVEILENTITQNPRINGIIIYGLELKISLYADDMTFLSNEASLHTALLDFEIFYKMLRDIC